jgi:hypothetical protein
MGDGRLTPQAPTPVRGFLVEDDGKVPAIGSAGVNTQFFCPLIKSACIKQACMAWVELFQGDGMRVAHCGFLYWTPIQLTDIKSQLIQLNREKGGVNAAARKEPVA